jgi:hypothetical protein
MTAPAEGGQAQRRTPSGGGVPLPLNLIHRTKPSNPIGMRVTARFESEEGLPLGTLTARCPLSFLAGWRAANGAKYKP